MSERGEPLSKKDRLILMNQYRILKAVEPDQARYYDKLINVLENGYEWAYYELF